MIKKKLHFININYLNKPHVRICFFNKTDVTKDIR